MVIWWGVTPGAPPEAAPAASGRSVEAAIPPIATASDNTVHALRSTSRRPMAEMVRDYGPDAPGWADLAPRGRFRRGALPGARGAAASGDLAGHVQAPRQVRRDRDGRAVDLELDRPFAADGHDTGRGAGCETVGVEVGEQRRVELDLLADPPQQ